MTRTRLVCILPPSTLSLLTSPTAMPIRISITATTVLVTRTTTTRATASKLPQRGPSAKRLLRLRNILLVHRALPSASRLSSTPTHPLTLLSIPSASSADLTIMLPCLPSLMRLRPLTTRRPSSCDIHLSLSAPPPPSPPVSLTSLRDPCARPSPSIKQQALNYSASLPRAVSITPPPSSPAIQQSVSVASLAAQAMMTSSLGSPPLNNTPHNSKYVQNNLKLNIESQRNKAKKIPPPPSPSSCQNYQPASSLRTDPLSRVSSITPSSAEQKPLLAASLQPPTPPPPPPPPCEPISSQAHSKKMKHTKPPSDRGGAIFVSQSPSIQQQLIAPPPIEFNAEPKWENLLPNSNAAFNYHQQQQALFLLLSAAVSLSPPSSPFTSSALLHPLPQQVNPTVYPEMAADMHFSPQAIYASHWLQQFANSVSSQPSPPLPETPKRGGPRKRGGKGESK
eukprot:GDKJ01008651.1.p2 GENE.GDKJ01008651.1~~GDKJ01008651.1.p2  ORF type:complete len:452 (-),score=154.10 GDKJ01008651.1:579-1934(-)